MGSCRYHETMSQIRQAVLQLHGDNNILPGGASLILESVVALEIYSLADLQALRKMLLRAVPRVPLIDSRRRTIYLRQIEELIRDASTEIYSDSLRNLPEIPLGLISDSFSSYSLGFEVIGGSLVIAYVFLRPSDALKDFFAQISRTQINTSINFKKTWLLAGKPLPIIKRGNDIKSKLIADADSQILVEVAHVIRQLLGSGISLECFGGVPIIQYFSCKPRPARNNSLNSNTFLTLLYQAGVGVKYSDYYSMDEDSLVEQRREASPNLRALSKIVFASDKYLLEVRNILSLFAAKEILKLQVYKLSLIEREYISLSAKKKTKGLVEKRLELYRLKTVNGIISNAIDKMSQQPYRIAANRLLNDFTFNGSQLAHDGYFFRSKQAIKSLRVQIDKSLHQILSDSETVRDESNARFQSNVGKFTMISGCLALALAIASIVVSLVLAPMAQIRLERWVAKCFESDARVGAKARAPVFLCESLRFLR